jgi:nucleotide-binding universal stress UspA family protein
VHLVTPSGLSVEQETMASARDAEPRRTVLVAISGSDEATATVSNFVNTFFRACEVDVLALNVQSLTMPTLAAPVFPWPYPAPSTSPAMVRSAESYEEVARERGEQLIERSGLAQDASVVAVGAVASEIRRVAVERQVDLLVVGANDRGLVDRLLHPPVAKELLRDAPCPVLVVPA